MNNERKNIEQEFIKQRGEAPFVVPAGYFDSLEDRIMNSLPTTQQKKGRVVSFVRILKPALTIAASIVLVYLIASVPFTRKIKKDNLSAQAMNVIQDDSTFNFSLIDESTLVKALFSEEQSGFEKITQEEMLAYLSSGMNEVQIVSQLQN
jgi:hypothetical protein